jgi:hypothetical protein
MNVPIRHLRSIACSGLALFAVLLAPVRAVTIDFEGVDASGGSVTGTELDNYLASYGVSISNVTGTNNDHTPATVSITSDANYYGGGVVTATSGTNFLIQNDNSGPESFTLSFAAPVDNLSFNEIAIDVPSAIAQWSAVAYDTNGDQVGSSVGESLFSGTSGAQAFSILGTDITSLQFTSNGFDFAGIPSVPIDDVSFTEVPFEPQQGLGLVLLGLGVGARTLWRKKAVLALARA